MMTNVSTKCSSGEWANGTDSTVLSRSLEFEFSYLERRHVKFLAKLYERVVGQNLNHLPLTFG